MSGREEVIGVLAITSLESQPSRTSSPPRAGGAERTTVLKKISVMAELARKLNHSSCKIGPALAPLWQVAGRVTAPMRPSCTGLRREASTRQRGSRVLRALQAATYPDQHRRKPAGLR